jgi:hypothetical protein
MSQRVDASCFLFTFALTLLSIQARAQPAPSGPPAVGVVRAERQKITQIDAGLCAGAGCGGDGAIVAPVQTAGGEDDEGHHPQNWQPMRTARSN